MFKTSGSVMCYQHYSVSKTFVSRIILIILLICSSVNVISGLHCPLLTIVHGKVIDVVQTSNSSVVSKARIICDIGYKLNTSASDRVYCIHNGTWVGDRNTALPTCFERENCNPPREVEFGDVSIKGDMTSEGKYVEGSIAMYLCNSSFELRPRASTERICRGSVWVGDEPTCIGFVSVPVVCEHPSGIQHGTFFPAGQASFGVGTVVHYACDPGYSLTGNRTFECAPGGYWKPSRLPKCMPSKKERECRGPLDVPRAKYTVWGWVTPDGVVDGTQLDYECEPGYRDTITPCVTARLTCKGGQWEGHRPNCGLPIPPGCSEPPSSLTADRVTPSSPTRKYQVGSRVYYTCRSGHMLGSSHLTCYSGGCWYPSSPPRCDDNMSMGDGQNNDKDGSMVFLLDARTVSLLSAVSIMGLLLLVLAGVVLHRHRMGKVDRQEGGPRTTTSIDSLRPGDPALGQPPGTGVLRAGDTDRVALIAYADRAGGVQLVLPSYEEAIRCPPPPPYEPLGGGALPRAVAFPPRSSRSRRHQRHPRDTSDTVSHHSIHVSHPSASSSHTASLRSASIGDSLGSTDTMTPSEGSTNVTVETLSSNYSSGSGSQPSTRALCGSLLSFDNCSVINTEGVPLLEENEEVGDDTCRSLSQQESDSNG